jgi:hypothetical protein
MDLDIFQHPKFTRESGVDIAPAVVLSTTTSSTPTLVSPKVVSQTASPSTIPPTAPSSSPRKIITAVLPSFPTNNGGSASSSTTSSLSLSPRLDGMVHCPQAAAAATTITVGSLLPEAPSLTLMKAADAANSNYNCNNARSTATTDATINSLLLKELLRERETLLHGMDRLSQTVASLLQTQQQLPQPTTTTTSSAHPHLLHQYGSYQHHHHHHYSSYGNRATTPPSAPPPPQHHQATRYY